MAGELSHLRCFKVAMALSEKAYPGYRRSILAIFGSPMQHFIRDDEAYLCDRLKQSIDSKNPRGPGLRGFLCFNPVDIRAK
jgi:hypothetical protein